MKDWTAQRNRDLSGRKTAMEKACGLHRSDTIKGCIIFALWRMIPEKHTFILLIISKDQWEKRIIEGFYHDCSLLFEDDHVYIVSGNRNIRLQELKKDLSGPKEGGLDRILVSDSRNPGLGFEGSHFL